MKRLFIRREQNLSSPEYDFLVTHYSWQKSLNLVWKVVWILLKIIKKTPHGVNH